ncbi:MAG: hypothetical protein DRP70_15560 [Spirochaetes bacterium]|nr:MAG: hypothetical protein DRP70_15560 [Spirochaetota bacterium]
MISSAAGAEFLPHRGYALELDHHRSERSVDLDPEVLSPSISQYEKDSDLNQFHHLFGNLSDFKRRERGRTNGSTIFLKSVNNHEPSIIL